MKKILTFCLVLVGLNMYAQDDHNADHQLTVNIPAVALVDIEGGNITAAFTTGSTAEAGLALQAPANNTTTWLNYSSIKDGSTMKQVKVKADKLVPGLDIKVTAGADAGAGAGAVGTAVVGGVVLSTTDQALVTGIGSAYTGNGTSKGHNLTYSFELKSGSDYGNLEKKSHVITVTYTIAD